MDLIEYLSTWHLKNYERAIPDTQVYGLMGESATDLNESSQPIIGFSILSMKSEILRHLLRHLLPIMEHQTNLKLKPIYALSRLYLGGAELKNHIDRKACEISASITVKYFYENKNYKWPLCMGDIPIVIKSGDGVIYKGCEIEHWRPIFQQPKEYWHHQIFLHYVDLNGPYSDVKEEI